MTEYELCIFKDEEGSEWEGVNRSFRDARREARRHVLERGALMVQILNLETQLVEMNIYPGYEVRP